MAGCSTSRIETDMGSVMSLQSKVAHREGEGGMFQENSIETCILSRVKQISGPGCIHETSARTWCSGRTWRERVGREVGGGIGMGTTCEPKAFSFQCMTKFTTNKKNKVAHKWPQITTRIQSPAKETRWEISMVLPEEMLLKLWPEGWEGTRQRGTVVKNVPANAGDIRDAGLIPG